MRLSLGERVLVTTPLHQTYQFFHFGLCRFCLFYVVSLVNGLFLFWKDGGAGATSTDHSFYTLHILVLSNSFFCGRRSLTLRTRHCFDI